MSDAGQIRAFHAAMLDIFWRTLNEVPLLGYTAGTFGQEIRQFGGLEAAKRCIHSEQLGAGFVALSQIRRLDLTLEALIHDNPKWHALFSEEELAICAERLRKHAYHKILRDR
jgi:hypothetical protein